jgi:hypothetical protein
LAAGGGVAGFAGGFGLSLSSAAGAGACATTNGDCARVGVGLESAANGMAMPANSRSLVFIRFLVSLGANLSAENLSAELNTAIRLTRGPSGAKLWRAKNRMFALIASVQNVFRFAPFRNVPAE